MKRSTFSGARREAELQRSSALLITLFILSLMAIIIVAFLGTMTWEMQASSRNYEDQQARAVATLGLHTAVAKLRTAFSTWDAPYGKYLPFGATLGGFVAAPPANYYSISPGILTRWSYTSVNASTNYALFSQPTDTTTLTVNLNAPEEDGTYPILGTSTALNVYWSDVLANPKLAASSANRIVGRYAFWIDDENSKININTADGTLNTNLPPSPCGLGWGTPTAVSLQVLQSGGTPLSTTTASNIVAYARTTGFNSPREILRVAGTSPDLYTNNVFNLTTMSRSPDFNIFGLPKIPLVPSNYANNYIYAAPGFAYNLSTLQPLTELFPGQAILPKLTMSGYAGTVSSANGTATSSTYSGQNWPLPFGQLLATSISPAGVGDGGWNMGWIITSYLSGKWPIKTTTALTWPEFPGSSPSATSYLGKYADYQLDSITLQILNLAGKDVSPDVGQGGGAYTRSSDSAMRGWLSGQLVSGLGRAPKLDKVLLVFQARPAVASPPAPSFSPPAVQAQMYMEFWMPSGFQGVSLFHNSLVYNAFHIGDAAQPQVMNAQDMGQIITSVAPAGNTNDYLVTPAPLPKVGANTIPPTIGAYIPTGTNYSYWGNNLLQTTEVAGTPSSPIIDAQTLTYLQTHSNGFTNNGGVDWNGNNQSYPDMDQLMAAAYHPYAPTNASGQYLGEGLTSGGPGTQIMPIFFMAPFVNPNPGLHGDYTSYLNDWAPGQYRCVANNLSVASYASPMSTNAIGTNAGTLYVFGGVQYLDELDPNRLSVSGAVPLDSMKGSAWNSGGGWVSTIQNRTGDPFVGSTLMPAFNNVLQAVIPVNAAVPVPAAGFTLGNPVYVYDSVADPLVNKFPGDWGGTNVSFSDPTPGLAPTFSSEYPRARTLNTPGSAIYTDVTGDNSTCAIYPETSATDTQTQLQDPASYWVPTIDCMETTNAVGSGVSGLALEAPQIPRTARFPSVGYLQYVRTGIMPDDESGSYSQWHGTPFRLLNFNASTDPSQTVHSVSYPDWAMLDLFYVPSTLLSPGSPYEIYAGTNYTLGSGNANYGTNAVGYVPQVAYTKTNVVNNMLQFGTYGGATSGRINPNGAVVYTTNANIPTPGITRLVPLEAQLHGIQINPTVTGSAMHGNDFWSQTSSAITNVDEVAVANSIATYLSTNNYGPGGIYPGPLRMPEEICNVPAVAAAVAPINPLHTRNDLVRQIVGNLTTQSNTFSVWVEAQSIQKSKANTQYGVYQSGDQITGTIRYHFIVERELDPGIDGVYGNVNNPGPDGLVGTIDDPKADFATGAGSYNWAMPAYFYRVIYAEEIR